MEQITGKAQKIAQSVSILIKQHDKKRREKDLSWEEFMSIPVERWIGNASEKYDVSANDIYDSLLQIL